MAFKITATTDAGAFEDEKGSALQSITPGAEKLVLEFSGHIDRSWEDLGRQKSEFKVEVTGQEPMSFEGELRTVAENNYIRLT